MEFQCILYPNQILLKPAEQSILLPLMSLYHMLWNFCRHSLSQLKPLDVSQVKLNLDENYRNSNICLDKWGLLRFWHIIYFQYIALINSSWFVKWKEPSLPKVKQFSWYRTFQKSAWKKTTTLSFINIEIELKKHRYYFYSTYQNEWSYQRCFCLNTSS